MGDSRYCPVANLRGIKRNLIQLFPGNFIGRIFFSALFSLSWTVSLKRRTIFFLGNKFLRRVCIPSNAIEFCKQKIFSEFTHSEFGKSSYVIR